MKFTKFAKCAPLAILAFAAVQVEGMSEVAAEPAKLTASFTDKGKWNGIPQRHALAAPTSPERTWATWAAWIWSLARCRDA